MQRRCLIQWATFSIFHFRFPFTLCVAAPSTQPSRPAAYNGKWPERAIIDHMYNAALYSGGLRRWCCRPTFTSRPFDLELTKVYSSCTSLIAETEAACNWNSVYYSVRICLKSKKLGARADPCLRHSRL